MTEGWELLGSGAALAWFALPLLTRMAQSRASREPASLHRRLVWVLTLSAALLTVPALGTWLVAPSSRSPLRLALQVLAPRGTDDPSMVPALVKLREFAVSPFAIAGILWTIVCAFAALRALVLGWRLRQLIARAHPAPDSLVTRLRQLSQASGVVPPALLVSDEAAAPFTFGPRAPVVVLPASLIDRLDDAQHDLVLRHEIEHVRRGDLQSSILVEACAVLFAGNRAAHFLVQEIRLAREAAVDAEVSGSNPHAYAALLVDVASLARSGESLASVSMDDTALSRRITMLNNRRTNEPTLGPRAVIVAAVVTAVLGFAAPTIFAAASSALFDKGRRDAPAFPPPLPHEDEIEACYEAALKITPHLVIDTFVHLAATVDGTVVAAAVPSPESPFFQRCVEDKALGWSFPPPSDAPPPPPGVQLQVSFRIQLPKH